MIGHIFLVLLAGDWRRDWSVSGFIWILGRAAFDELTLDFVEPSSLSFVMLQKLVKPAFFSMLAFDFLTGVNKDSFLLLGRRDDG